MRKSDDTNLSYALITLEDSVNHTVYHNGICAPSQCTEMEVLNSISDLYKSLYENQIDFSQASILLKFNGETYD